MNRTMLLLVLVGAAFAAGVVHMLNVEFDAGGVYPEYSSLRTDPRGARLLYDSLARIPGVTAIRNYAPIETLDDSRSSIVLLGLRSTFGDPDDLKLYEHLAQHGNRLIAAFDEIEVAKSPASLSKQWGVKLGTYLDLKRCNGQFFLQHAGWEPLDREGDKPVAIERRFGEGSIILIASSEDFTNKTSVTMDRLAAISALLGERTRIVFDEAHLGIAESGSVVGLARRFRLRFHLHPIRLDHPLPHRFHRRRHKITRRRKRDPQVQPPVHLPHIK